VEEGVRPIKEYVMRKNIDIIKEDFKVILYSMYDQLSVWTDNLRQVFRKDFAGYTKYEKDYFFNDLSFEVTNVCNAKCTFCAYRFLAPTMVKGRMDFEIFKKATDDYIANGGKKISFTATIGDPLLDPGVVEKIKYAVSRKRLDKIYMITNGISLNKNDYYKELVDSGLNPIKISLACFEKEVWEKVYGVNAYGVFLEGVRNLLEYNANKKNPTNIVFLFRSPYLPSNTIDTSDFKKYIGPYLGRNVDIDFCGGYGNWSGAVTQDDLFGVMTLRKERRSYRLPCRRTFDAVVLYDGSIRLCGCKIKDSEFDELVIGNVMEEDLLTICHGKRAAEVRARFYEDDLPEVCKLCNEYTPINGHLKDSLYFPGEDRNNNAGRS
jgi:uncharacterized Fe-S cluster-containing radical SAM superfamily protein